jgi:hypothetical protein
MAVAVSPVGNVSVTVTVPEVGPRPLLVTTMLYWNPVCPLVALPLWLFAMVRSGLGGGGGGAAEQLTVADIVLGASVPGRLNNDWAEVALGCSRVTVNVSPSAGLLALSLSPVLK